MCLHKLELFLIDLSQARLLALYYGKHLRHEGYEMSLKLDVLNPRTGQVDYHITAEDAAMIKDKAARLRSAQIAWQEQGLAARGESLIAFAKMMEKHKDHIIKALETDTGRRRIAQDEFSGIINLLNVWPSLAAALMPSGDWVQGRSKPHFKHSNDYVPYALVGVISPWNFPLTLSFIDAIPALLAGGCVMIKPSEVTPRFADALTPVIKAAGLEDILCFVQGGGASGAALIDYVDTICFTGSVATGRKVAQKAAENLIPANLELGGKDPLIITQSADIHAAAALALRASTLATGQACQSIERIYVAQEIYAPFIETLTAQAKNVKLNYPDIDKGHIGPFIFPAQAQIVERQIQDALDKGAKCLTGGKVLRHGGGYWLEPTILTHVNHDMVIMREETFGPVMPVMAYETIQEAISLANDTQFGLSAAVFARDIDEAHMIAAQIDAGAISLMDGALTGQYFEAGKQSFKNSGLGASRMGQNGFLRFFRQKAYIANTASPLTIDDFQE